MKFTASIAIAGLTTMVNAKASFTNSAFNVVVGQSFNITWADSDGSGPFSLYLKSGPSNNLETVQTLTSGTSDFSYVFTPSSGSSSPLTSDTNYSFEIIDSTNVPNYSQQFTIRGLDGSSSSTPGTSTSTASSTSSSSHSTTKSSTSSTSESSTTSTPSTTSHKTSTSSSSSASTTSSSNSTITSTTLTTASSSSTTSTSASTTFSQPATESITNTSDSQRFSSPIALLLVTVAALAFFN